MEHHLNSYEDETSNVAKKLLKSMYVDNCVTSVDNIQEYEEFKKSSIHMMEEAKMNLREWEHTFDQTEVTGVENDGTTGVLGYKWNKYQDSIFCDIQCVQEELPAVITKRVLLSKIQQVFDPLGFLSPAMIKPKLLLQTAWTKKPASEVGVMKNKNDISHSATKKGVYRSFNEKVQFIGC